MFCIYVNASQYDNTLFYLRQQQAERMGIPIETIWPKDPF